MKEDSVENRLIPYSFAKKHGILAKYDQKQQNYVVYHLSETPWRAFTEVQRVLPNILDTKIIDKKEFQNNLAQIYQSPIANATDNFSDSDLELMDLATYVPASEDLLDIQDDAPIIQLINALFTQAIKQHSSDIHIETYENRVLIRNRIDGILHEVLELQRNIAPLVISRIKVMAKLDISEKRIPQDGRISLKIGGHAIDVRVSTLPANHGERIVLRILDKNTAKLDIKHLGLDKDTLENIKTLINEPHGILLVTGPTGSGKTTSLYGMLNELNQISRNILTIEDPIEYDLPGVGQTQVNTKVNMSFAKGLRAILRQDPDVVMIGEIRDLETAEIAIQASLTGHLVLSTLHTNSAIGAITRLHDMGVESFLLSSSIIGLLAQRLVRRLCDNCKEHYELRLDERQLMNLAQNANTKNVCHAKGCEQCNYLGYKGRSGIYELIMIDDKMRSMIHLNENIQTIEQYIRTLTPSIRDYGFAKVLAGETSLSEILRVTTQNS
jgi:general secretion pathway protein E